MSKEHMAGYRFDRKAAEELRTRLEKQGRLTRMEEVLLSGYGIRGQFENKKVFKIFTRSK